MKVSGSRAKRKDLGVIPSIQVQSMRDTGRGTKNMEKEPSNFAMGINTQETGKTISKMAKVH